MVWNYLGMLSIATLAVAVLSVFQGALSTPCLHTGECLFEEFCDLTRHECVQCLHCEDLKREPPSASRSCIESVRDCGPCLKGLIQDRMDDLNCVSPTDRDGQAVSSSNNTTMWVVVGLVVAGLIGIGVVLAYYWRSRTTKFQTNAQIETILPVSYPTAPEFPPPYRPNPSMDRYQPAEETDLPLIKTDPPNSIPLRYLDSEDPVRANMYDPPAYVRYGSPTERPTEPEENNQYHVHSETTRESLWTPEPTNNNNFESLPPVVEPTPAQQPPALGALSAALAVARSTELLQPPTKRLKSRESTDNMERSDDDAHDSAHMTSQPSRSAQPFNIVNLNIQVNQK